MRGTACNYGCHHVPRGRHWLSLAMQERESGRRLGNLAQHTTPNAAAAAPGAAAPAGTSSPFSPMPPWDNYESYTGGGGRTATGLVRQCTMLKCRSDPKLMEGYKEWHRKVWPELQHCIRVSGVSNYNIFMRADGLLFLYLEMDMAQAARQAADPAESKMNAEVGAKWQALMSPFLDPDFEFNGPLEHVFFMGVDERVMDPAAATRPPPPLHADTPNPAYGGYSSYTGGGGRSLGGRLRTASQLMCRQDAMPEYNEWHRKVFPELQIMAFEGGIRNYSIFQRRDGLLFLYNEIDTAAATVPPLDPNAPPIPGGVSERWETLMDQVGLIRDAKYNGLLEHVMYIGDDRSMDNATD